MATLQPNDLRLTAAKRTYASQNLFYSYRKYVNIHYIIIYLNIKQQSSIFNTALLLKLINSEV